MTIESHCLPNNPRAAIVRQLEESEKVLEMSKNKTSSKENTPNEGNQAKQKSPRLGDVKD